MSKGLGCVKLFECELRRRLINYHEEKFEEADDTFRLCINHDLELARRELKRMKKHHESRNKHIRRLYKLTNVE